MQLLIKRQGGQDIWQQREQGCHVMCCGYSSQYFGGVLFSHVCYCRKLVIFWHVLTLFMLNISPFTIEQCLMSIVLFFVVNAHNDALFDCERTQRPP